MEEARNSWQVAQELNIWTFMEVQGLNDAEPHSMCPLPSPSLIEDLGCSWLEAERLNVSFGVYVSLFKVRLGRGAPCGDFPINNTSTEVCSSFIIKLIFPLSLRASFFMYPFGIECDPKSKRSSPSSWKSTRQEEFLPSSDRNAKLSQAKPSVLYPFASLQQRIKPGFNVSIAEADYNILSELQ